MKSITRTTTATTAVLALLATPAFGQEPPQGQTTSPAKICSAQNLSHKKTNHGKGKSPFAACVVGV